jgi:mRNA interferase MazF
MTSFNRGDVVMVDLGVAAKVRPCVVVSVANPDTQRNMSVVVPMTTEIRGPRTERDNSPDRASGWSAQPE